MNLNEICSIENDAEQVQRIYEYFDENSRLNHSKAARVEFLTTVHYIEKYLPHQGKILDIGAGAGTAGRNKSSAVYRREIGERNEQTTDQYG